MESLPGAVSIFAQAYQNQLSATGKGGGKQGQEAITELLAAMKKGNVRGDILTYAGSVASERAAPGLSAASTASQAEQARYQNQINDLSVLASKSGIEDGFARIFRTLNDGLQESGPLVKSLSEGFNEATKSFRILALIPQSFQRMLQGRDSYITQLIGENKAEEVRALFREIEGFGTNFRMLTDNIAIGWSLIYEKISGIQNFSLVKGMTSGIGAASDAVGAVNSLAMGNDGAAKELALSAGKSYFGTITAPARAVLDTAGDALGLGKNSVSDFLGLGGSRTQNTTITIGDLNITSPATTTEGFALDLQNQMKPLLENAWTDAQSNYVKSGR